jgi:hypothetical protein
MPAIVMKPNKIYRQMEKAIRGQNLGEIFMTLTMLISQILVCCSESEEEALIRAKRFHDDISNTIRFNAPGFFDEKKGN